MPQTLRSTAVVAVVFLLASCGTQTVAHPRNVSQRPARSSAPRVAPVAVQFANPLPGMPPVIDGDVYSQTRVGHLSTAVAGDPADLYVPDALGSTVTVISQHTRKIIRVIHTGFLSQHVVPSYDLRTLVTNSSAANELVLIDPHTAKKTRTIGVPRPYNLYYTPDGKAAIVMVEQHNQIRFSDPKTFRKIADVSPKGCKGPNHADFSANGRYFIASCEFSGELVKIDTVTHKVLAVIKLDPIATAPHAARADMHTSMPQDVRLSPDGRTFYVADTGTNELRLIDTATFRQRSVIGMPSHPHGLYPSRDGKKLYISDRGAGKVSVLDFATHKIVDTWVIPGGGSPDMGGVSADGSMLWLSGRYDGVVYGFDTVKGKLVATIKVGGSPHGVAVWPQPGRYSLGHTGNMR